MIFHLVGGAAWAAAVEQGAYRPPSLAQQGFVHLSTSTQVLGTANRFFAGRTDLLMLRVDERALGGLLKYEEGEVGQLFPHFYGALPIAAVIDVAPLSPDADGVFRTLPGEEDACIGDEDDDSAPASGCPRAAKGD